MTERRRRKKNKLRGQRTMGAGDTKNRRGGGSRGGRGKANSTTGKFASIGRFKPTLYRQKPVLVKGKTIKLGELDSKLEEFVLKGLITKEGDKFIVEKKSGLIKVLTSGETNHKIVLRINATAGAIKKIIAAGGKFEFNKKKMKIDEEETQFSGDEDDEEIEFKEKEENEEQKLLKP